MLILPSDTVTLEWIDPATIAIHPDCRVDGERVQAYRHELRLIPGATLPPILVVEGEASTDGNHRLLAYRAEGVTRALAVIVVRKDQ